MLVLFFIIGGAFGCTTILVGKKASKSGAVLGT